MIPEQDTGVSTCLASVIVPVFDNPSGLETTLVALEAQSTKAFEVIIVDDGSNMAFGAAVESVVRQYRWRVVRTENRGPAAARNTGAGLATTDVLLFVDCRDQPVTDWVESFAAAYAPGTGIVRSGARYRYTGLSAERCDQVGQCVLPGTFAIHRSVFAAVDGYDEVLRFGENGDLINRAHQHCSQNGLRVALLERELVVINDPADSRRYDRQRLEAMEWMLRRDEAALRQDRNRRAKLASIGAVNALRARERRRALRLAGMAVKAAPNHATNWFRLGLCLLPHAASRAWFGRADRGSGQLVGEPCNGPATAGRPGSSVGREP